MLPRFRGLEGVLGVLSIVLLLGTFRPSYAATQEQIDEAIATLTTNSDRTKKKGKNYWEVSGDSVKHAVMWDTTFSGVRLSGRPYARADIAYRVFDSGEGEIFAQFLNTRIPQGMTMDLVWDTDKDTPDGKLEAHYRTTLGLKTGYDPMNCTYIQGKSPEHARKNSKTPTKLIQSVYGALLSILKTK